MRVRIGGGIHGALDPWRVTGGGDDGDGDEMERKRWECSALPQGWKKEEVTRRSGLSAGKSDVYYYRLV